MMMMIVEKELTLMLIMSRSTNKNITQSKRETAMIQPVLLHNVEKVSEST